MWETKLLKVNFLCTSCVEGQCAQHPNSIGNKILREGQERGESMEITVKGVVDLFQTSLKLFSQCHNIYNKKLVSEDEVSELGMYILTMTNHCR